ncbi:glycoside hydrolase [Dipodascopsis tothii]|uniref:glycoside hydrolase n=1 Tax=Dipodascopsis tothii TaxID=44089 RepID=UPI0034CD652F
MKLSKLAAAQLALPALALFSSTVNAISYENSTATTTSWRSLFTVPAEADTGANLLPNIKDPEAINAQAVCPGYVASSIEHSDTGLTAILTLAGKACNAYGTDIEKLNLTVEYQSSSRLAVSIIPAVMDSSNTSYYMLSETIVPRPQIEESSGEVEVDGDLVFSYSNDPAFSFKVTRKSTGDVLFTTEGTVIVFENQFIEFVSTLPEEYNLYGLGEQIHGFRLGNNYTATIFAADVGDPIDGNIYGSHPFYVDTRYFEENSETGELTLVTTGNTSTTKDYVSYSHGVFLRNAHAQEVLLQPNNITWRTLGGSIDLFFYSGPTTLDVTQEYQVSTTGLPAMQQYFTFGYHQCRWGYQNWTVLAEVVSNFEKFEIPLETIWTDIDYMKLYRDFENDPNTFDYESGREFLADLHAGGRHYVPIVDSAIYIPNPENATDAYEPYNRGHEADVFLRNPDGSEYIGAVWPGYTVFPDWHAANAVEWWASEMAEWHCKVPFDGIWIDMSEVSSFCIGSCGTNNLTLNPVHPSFGLPGELGSKVFDYPEGFEITNATEASSAASASASQSAYNAGTATPVASNATTTATSATSTSYLRTTPTLGVRNIEHPPYVINNQQGDLSQHAVSPNATHSDGVLEYDVHNLFGHQILNATYHGLLKIFPEKRPFIIGRSTFAGTGKWAGHWGGDNASKWYMMFFSIPQALSFSLFGIPMFGVDTCGFNGNSDYELCSRWMQLSAFFPFYRNHNELSTISQEPYIWSSVMDAAKTAMAIRYALLPYMYTLFNAAHETGSTVMRALAWEFPNEPQLAEVSTQFMLGPSLMIVPVLEPQVDTVKGVFPGVGDGEVWYDWYTQIAFDAEPGVNTTLSAPLGHIPVFVRGGSVLPLHEPALTTTKVRNSPWSLIAALSAEGTASGEVYVDDGESLIPESTLFVDFVATNGTLSATTRGEFKDYNPLANVTVLGVSSAPVGNVTFNGATVPSADVAYNGTAKTLTVTGLNDFTCGGAWTADWSLSW